MSVLSKVLSFSDVFISFYILSWESGNLDSIDQV